MNGYVALFPLLAVGTVAWSIRLQRRFRRLSEPGTVLTLPDGTTWTPTIEELAVALRTQWMYAGVLVASMGLAFNIGLGTIFDGRAQAISFTCAIGAFSAAIVRKASLRDIPRERARALFALDTRFPSLRRKRQS